MKLCPESGREGDIVKERERERNKQRELQRE